MLLNLLNLVKNVINPRVSSNSRILLAFFILALGLLYAEGKDRRYFFSNLLTGQEHPDIFISNGC